MMNYLEKKKKALLNYVSGGRLPSEYQEVEWIGSSGSQYIDSGYGTDEDRNLIKIEYIAEILSPATWCVSGIGASTPFCYVGANMGRHKFAYGGNSDTVTNIAYNSEKRTFIVDYLNGIAELLDGETVIGSTTFTTTSGVLRKNICLFGYINQVSSAVSKHNAKYYEYKIYNNNVLERNFIPCYRKSDNEIGMYDTVNQTFYTNAGSGTFTKGQDV